MFSIERFHHRHLYCFKKKVLYKRRLKWSKRCYQLVCFDLQFGKTFGKYRRSNVWQDVE